MIRNNLLRELFSAPYQLVLVVSFSSIAAITIAIGALATSKTISDYLTDAMNERIARDMQLAQVFYNDRLANIESITTRISKDAIVIDSVQKSLIGDENLNDLISLQVQNHLLRSELGGNHLLVVINKNKDLLTWNKQLNYVKDTQPKEIEDWSSFKILENVLLTGQAITSTEVVPSTFLNQVSFSEQARIMILETPKAAPELVDPREGTDGLGLISISPINSEAGETIGAVLTMHILNNDFTLVDKIRQVAGVDTATIFLGDLRVSTNVMTLEGERAIGTRVSEEVSQVVFGQGKEFVGQAFVVNQDYITRYDPIQDHSGEVIGILYVGSKQASFQRLVNLFNQRIVLVAIGTIFLTILIATPVSHVVTWPLKQLKSLVEANQRVAEGDMSVRVSVHTRGEIGLLESSFNSMLDTLQATQDQLIQTEKLASIGQLAAGVAHELNNPLGTILLYSDILLNEIPPDSSQKKDLEIIINETKRCKWIVSTLLEFARHNHVNAQSTDLNCLIQYVVEVEEKHFEEELIEFKTEFDKNLPEIQIDPGQIQQVLFNLIENAIEAMPKGGSITIRTRNEPAEMVTIEIEDTGVGIPPEQLSLLFKPFYTTKPMGKGVGLGLSIVYGIIKLHRGQVSVQSSADTGTKFIIQLPIKHQSINNADQIPGFGNNQTLGMR